MGQMFSRSFREQVPKESPALDALASPLRLVESGVLVLRGRSSAHKGPEMSTPTFVLAQDPEAQS
jgi:hypothetical protein